MSLAGSEHCSLLYTRYLEIKESLGLSGPSFEIDSGNIIGSLGNILDTSLDVADSVIGTVQSPVLDPSDITDSLASAIESCPALRYIPGYDTMVDQILAGDIVDLPPITLRSLSNDLKDTLIGLFRDSLDTDTFDSIDGLRAYQENLISSNIPDDLDIIDEIESCLIASCGTLTTAEKVGATFRSQYKLTSGGSLDMDAFADSTSLTASKLESTFNSYVDKFSDF
jgi:hypothetical protein